MSFTTEVIVYCVITPAIIAGVAACIAGWLSQRHAHRGISDGGSYSASQPGSRGGVIMVAGWCVAVAVSLATRQWFGQNASEGDSTLLTTIISGESWQLALWPMIGFGMVLASTSRAASFDVSWRYPVAGMLAAAAGFLTLPAGENWQDLLPLHRPWFALIVVACLANAWSLERLARAGAARWCLLVLMAGMAVPLILGSLSYAAPAEWTVSALAATAAALLVATFWDWLAKAPIATYAVCFPASVLIATITSTARFYTWEDYPAWLYGISLFLPTLVCLIDFPIAGRSWKVRVPVAGVVSMLLIFACFWKLILSEPEQNW